MGPGNVVRSLNMKLFILLVLLAFLPSCDPYRGVEPAFFNVAADGDIKAVADCVGAIISERPGWSREDRYDRQEVRFTRNAEGQWDSVIVRAGTLRGSMVFAAINTSDLREWIDRAKSTFSKCGHGVSR